MATGSFYALQPSYLFFATTSPHMTHCYLQHATILCSYHMVAVFTSTHFTSYHTIATCCHLYKSMLISNSLII